jgi:hypothetical protein
MDDQNTTWTSVSAKANHDNGADNNLLLFLGKTTLKTVINQNRTLYSQKTAGRNHPLSILERQLSAHSKGLASVSDPTTSG